MIILKNAIEALPQGGKIIINEWVIKDEKTGPLSAAMLSLTMLIDTDMERLHALLRGKKPDRIPCMPFALGYPARLCQIPLGDIYANPELHPSSF